MPFTNVSLGTKILKLRCTYQTKKDMEGNSKKDIHFNKTSGSLSNVTTRSDRRTGKCISKKAKLYCTTFFAFSLDNDVICKNQDINDKRIVDISHVED